MGKEQKRYPIMKAPVLSFFAGDFYRDVAENWQGTGFPYLLSILTVSWLISTIAIALPITKAAFDKDAPAYTRQLPKMKLVNGKLSIDKPTPYFIKDPTGGESIAVFRTEPGARPEETDPPLLITQTEILSKGAASSYQTITDFNSLSALVPALEIDGAGLQTALEITAIGVPILIFCFGLPAIVLGHFLLALMYGAIGMLIANNSMQKGVTFETSLRITIVALTPTIVISTLLTALGSGTAALIFAVLSIPVAMAYTIFGLSRLSSSPGAETGF